MFFILFSRKIFIAIHFYKITKGLALEFGPEGAPIKGRVNQVLKFRGLEREIVPEAEAGDIVLINGIEELGIGCTVCAPEAQDALPMLKVDEPTLTMNFWKLVTRRAAQRGRDEVSAAQRAHGERKRRWDDV